MRQLHFAALAAFVFLLLAVRLAAVQPLREELPAAPTGDAPASEPGYLGLFADEAETPGKGVQVIEVHRGGPAEAAGLKRGDLITSIDGQAIAKVEEMGAALGDAPVGKKLRIEVVRDGKRSVHNLTLGKRPAEPPRLSKDDVPHAPPGKSSPGPVLTGPAPGPAAEASERASLGVRLSPLTDEVRRRHSLTVRQGAVIEGVREGSTADRFGLPLGGVIVTFDGRKVNSPDELVAALRAARAGDEVEVGYYQGERMFHKLVRLGPASPAASGDLRAPGPGELDPAVRPRVGVPGAADRPSLNKLDGLLERILPPAGAPPAAPPRDDALPRGAVDRSELIELRSEVELLKGEITRLTRKLSELEARLGEK